MQSQKQVHFFDGVDANAFHMPLDARFLKGKKCLIFLSQALRRMTKRNERKAIGIVLHEIAHYFLKYKTPIEYDPGSSGSDQQEIEADEQVKKWLRRAQPWDK
ncbi:MAG: hypothetical protein SH818_13205 [Saprospiraceae bacterium]|nr:hypothetical protein [Saprospiraceae bacterium]